MIRRIMQEGRRKALTNKKNQNQKIKRQIIKKVKEKENGDEEE